MFTLNGHIISSYKDFCDHFEYAGVIRQIRAFARWLDAGRRYMLTIQKDIDSILKLLRYADDEDCPVLFYDQGGCFTSDFSGLADEELRDFLREKVALLRRFDVLAGAAEMTQCQKRKVWLEGVAVYATAEKDASELDTEIIETCYKRQETSPDVLPEQINVYSGDTYEYVMFDPDTWHGKYPFLYTHRIKNCSSYGGGGAVIRLVKKGVTQYETVLDKDEYIYLNMIGSYAVKILPNLTFCGSHVIGRPDLRKNTVWRYKVDRAGGRIYGSEVLDLLPDKHISCMSVDYRGGLIYIEEGFLRNDSAVAFEGMYAPVLKEIRFVEAYVLKTRFLLLDEKGNTYSNIRRLDGLKDIVRIDIDGAKVSACGINGEQTSVVVYEEGKRYTYDQARGAAIREQCLDRELAAVFTVSGECRIVKADETKG